MKNISQPTYFISHGGGPWPYMEGEFRQQFRLLEDALNDMPNQLPDKPAAILMISAHWKAQEFRVMTSPQPPMIYDYGGFPEHTYHVTYPAPGSPELAEHVLNLLSAAGFTTLADPERGFDHGAFAPMMAIYPKADIPIVQLSIRNDFDPEAHMALGKALAPLRNEGVLLIGSGLSYHNLRKFGPAASDSSKEFDDWLQTTLCDNDFKSRANGLINWEQAPSARDAHPEEDHLIPLMVVVGAACEESGSCVYHEENFFGGITASSFKFG